MARSSFEDRLEVYLSGVHTGALTRRGNEPVEFRFRDEYLDLVPRPVLGQLFEDDLERTYRGKGAGELPPFFSNLVPEGRLRQIILDAAQISEDGEWELLRFVGADLPGAIEVRTSQSEIPIIPDLDLAQEPGDHGVAGEEDRAARLRFSLAGVQLKFSMLRDGEKLTLPAHGSSGDWIVKFPSPTFPHLPENEFSMMVWARESGFEVPELHLDQASVVVGAPTRWLDQDANVLSIRRFDRDDERRIHQEDFAQVVGLPPRLKYDQLTFEAMAILVRSIVNDEAGDEFVRRLVLMIACGNNDAHLKNWSLLYQDGIRAAWSPLYDQVATVGWPQPDRKLALKLGSVKDFGRIDRAAFDRFAERSGMDPQRVSRQVTETLSGLRRAWSEVGPDLPLPESHRLALEEHWQRMPVLREAGGLPG